MTTNKPEVKRYDCTSGGSSHCYGCYTMTETEDGEYVSAEDFEALQAECEKLRTALIEARANDQQAMAYLGEVRAIVGGDDFPDMVERCGELRKDADRYRWMRAPCSGAERVVTCERGYYGRDLMSGTMLDGAIDAALAAHLNPDSLLPPVGCWLLIEVNGELIKAKRTGYVKTKLDPLEYITETGDILTGHFRWTYP